MVTRKAPEAAATLLGASTPEAWFRGGERGTKRKVSLTMDESLVEDVRAIAGDRPLSAVVNDLLARAVAQHKLKELVDEMTAEAGEPSPEAYEHVLSQWFGDEDE